MDKETFLNKFNIEHKNLIYKLYDKIIRWNPYKEDIYTEEFLTPNIWTKLLAMENALGVKIETNGYFDEAERRIVRIGNNYGDAYDMVLLNIKNKSKFKTLKHSDYLGTIMSLGFAREKFGDLVLDKDECYVTTFRNIGDYVLANLNAISNCPVDVHMIEEKINLEPSFKELNIVSASSRLDGILPEIICTSRAKACDYILKGDVLVNYEVVLDKSRNLCDNDIITVHGFGKYKLIGIIGETAKGKIRLKIKKFI